MGHSFSLNGDVDGEPLCLALTSGWIAVLQGLNHWKGSVNSLSDVDGVGGRVSNCKHGIESEDEGARTKRGTSCGGDCRKRQPERVRGRQQTGSSRWTIGRLGCGEKEAV